VTSTIADPFAAPSDAVSDAAPPTTTDGCLECGVLIPYAGKGPRRKYCDAHKRRSAGVQYSSTADSSSSSKKDKLAVQAAGVLRSTNTYVVLGLMMVGLSESAVALSASQDAFEFQAIAALEQDPALCRTILKSGKLGAKLSLVVAYGAMGASVVPVAMSEYAQRRASAGDDPVV
jgi:hypothetical protein